MNNRIDKGRDIRAKHGRNLMLKLADGAPLRMLMNNLDKTVAEIPSELVVYGGIGRAAKKLAMLR